MIEKYTLFRIVSNLRDGEYSVRGLSNKAGIGVATSKTYLDYLLSKGIVKRKIVGRSHLYSLDSTSFLARSIKTLISLYELNESGIVKELVTKYPINSIILYGSVARGEDDSKSDVDILIISHRKIRISLKSERKLNRELSLIVYTLPEWKKKAREDKVFYDRVIVDGIPLYGEIPVVL